jgi:hypothetical protein
MDRRLKYLEKKNEISNARLLILKSKLKILYRFKASARQKDDVYIYCVVNYRFRSRKSI